MIRILILASLGAVISASPYFPAYSYDLDSLFGAKREVPVKNEVKERSLCETEECKLIAKVIKDSMDESMDPCDDFYEYACGKWSNNNPVPENMSTWSLWDMVQKKIEKQVEQIIETPAQPDDLFAVKLAKKWYQSCVDIESQRAKGVEPLLSTLWRHGGWPLIMEEGEWDDRVYNWQIVDDQFARLLGLNSFHDLTYGALSYDDNGTLLLDTPHLPPGIYGLLSSGVYIGSDSSDENNESGEGSQEKGSKEKGEENGENTEDNDDDEGYDEGDEDENEVEETGKRKVSGRRGHGRLGHNRKKSNGRTVSGKYSDDRKTRRRTKRDIIVENTLRELRKHAQHRNHKKSKTNGGLSRHAHLSVGHHTKASARKNDLKRKNEDGSVKVSDNGNHVGHRNKRVNDEDHEETRRKNHKRLGHGRRRNNKGKGLGRHVDGRTKKSKTTITTQVHGNKRHKHSVGHHGVHHIEGKVSTRRHMLASNETEGNEVDNEDSSDNEVDTEGNDEDGGNVTVEEGGDDNENEDKDEEEDDDEEEGEKNDDDGDNNENDGNDEKDENDDDEEDDDNSEEEREERIEKYTEYVLNVALVLSKARGIEPSRERLEKGVANLIEFMLKLGEITIVDYEPLETTLDSFQETYDSLESATQNSKVNWKRKVHKLFDEAGVEIEGDLEIAVKRPSYFEKLHSLLDETPSETIVSYIHWLFVSKLVLFTTEELEKLSEDWTGMGFESRKEQCIMMVEMSQIVGYEYTRKHFSEKTARTARDMIDDIQKEVEYQIKESTWMDDDTKHFILDKLVHMQNLVGYPDWYQNTTLVKRYFRGLTVGPSLYENVMSYIRYHKWKELQQVVAQDDEELPPEHSLDPLMLNAFFMPTENLIAITAVDFQSPFFAPNRPWNVNYGIIGVIMAHEVNHGFDDEGHLYDRTGEQMEWLSAMAAAYDKRADCFVHQFNQYDLIKGDNFTVEDYGNRTAGENIADTMGLQAVFRAYQRRQRECDRPDPALPGLEKFDNNQTFFLSFANLWCEAEDPEFVRRMAVYDVHSTGRLRVIGSVSNSDDFAKAFNCPVGSRMNPEKKCNIWV